MSLLLLFQQQSTPKAGSDTGGSLEAAALVAQPSSSDAGSSSSEATTLVVVLVSSDAGSSSESSLLTQRKTGADSGTSSAESTSQTAALASSDTGAGSETTKVKSAPQVMVQLWENGVLRQTIGTYGVTGTQTLDVAFDATLLADPTGAGVEIRLVSTQAFDVAAMVWDATYLSDGNQQLLTETQVATGVDSQSLTASSSSSDAGSSTESSTLFVYKISSDSLTGIDAIKNFDRTVYDFDEALGVDFQYVQKPPKVMLPGPDRRLVAVASFDLQ